MSTTNGPDNDTIATSSNAPDPVFRIVHSLALLLGVGSGVFTFQVAGTVDEQTVDRITGAQAKGIHDILRIQIDRNEERADDNKYEIEKLNDNSPSPQLVQQVYNLNRRLRSVELFLVKGHDYEPINEPTHYTDSAYYTRNIHKEE